jgi:hypothetical protein
VLLRVVHGVALCFSSGSIRAGKSQHQQAHVPDEPVFADELVDQPDHLHALIDTLGHERWPGTQSFCQIQDVQPAGAWWLVVVDGDGRIAMSGPIEQILIGAGTDLLVGRRHAACEYQA